MTELMAVHLEPLPSIDIAVGSERLLFVERVLSIARSSGHMDVELHLDTFGKEGLHFANFILSGRDRADRTGGQLIVRPDASRVNVEMHSADWNAERPGRDKYVAFSKEVFQPLLRSYNKAFGTRHRMRVARPSSPYQLPPAASRLFTRFAILANARSLHALDWERFYLFVRNSRLEAPEGALRPLLVKRGFPPATAEMLSDLYHHLWSF